jgi:hypothetical protein
MYDNVPERALESGFRLNCSVYAYTLGHKPSQIQIAQNLTCEGTSGK